MTERATKPTAGATWTCWLFASVVVGCGVEHRPPSPDAPVFDASTAPDGFVSYPCDLSDDVEHYACPASRPYCCSGALRDVVNYCYDEPQQPDTCFEYPIGGTRTACDVPTGDGCSAPDPICCASYGTTFCVDRELFGWTCTPA